MDGVIGNFTAIYKQTAKKYFQAKILESNIHGHNFRMRVYNWKATLMNTALQDANIRQMDK